MASLNAHKALRREFERVFDEVHEHLFESATVAIELWKSPVFVSTGRLSQRLVCTGRRRARVHLLWQAHTVGYLEG